MHGGVGFVNQDFSEFFVDPAARHTHEIGGEIRRRIAGQMQSVELASGHIGHKAANFRCAGIGEAKSGVRETRVATELRLGRFFQHDDLTGTALLGCHRRFKGGAPAADNYD